MKIAINKTVIGKPESDDRELHARMTKTYENVDISPEQLAEYVQKGYAFCAQHKDKWRAGKNFIASDFLAVDIDDGMTLDEAKNQKFVKENASFIYTTSSHSEEFHRFRIVFTVPETITNAQFMKNLMTGLVVMFSGDKACTDACRQFYGSKDCNIEFFGNTLEKSQLKHLLVQADELAGRSLSKGNTEAANTAIRSKITINLDTLLIDSYGKSHELRNAPERLTVHCPVHSDRNASAFVIKSAKGNPGVHCSTCRATFFTSENFPNYDFNYELAGLRSLNKEQVLEGVIEGQLVYEKRSVHFLNQRYLEPFETESPIVLVKSPKGSGKTQWLENVVEQAKKNKTPVLLIGHRQSLICALANRLGLTSYINFETTGESTKTNNAPTDYYAICADSLSIRLQPNTHKYPIILIDEVEQVLTHLTQATVKEKRNETFLLLKHYLNVAEKVFVMDADLNSLTVETLWDLVDNKNKAITFIANKYKLDNPEIEVYINEKQLIHDLIVDAKDGKRLFISCNSKRQVEQLHTSIEGECGEGIKILSITSDNSSKPDIQQFIREIKSEILNYDVVIASPSLGTGVDISFPNREQLIDVVYGFFHARVNTHFDMDQQVSRVRHPTKVRIWITPEKFRFESDAEIIKQEVLQSTRHARKLVGIEDDGTLLYDQGWDDKYLNLYSNAQSLERGSKNDLRGNYIRLKKFQGWQVKEIELDKEAAKKGSDISKLSKTELLAKVIQNTLEAKIVTGNEYDALKSIGEQRYLYEEQIWAMRRYEVESFYMESISEKLLKQDNQGKFRHQVNTYQNYTRSDSELAQVDQAEINRGIHTTDRKNLLQQKALLLELITSAGLADNDNLVLTEKEIQKEQLDHFTKVCKKRKAKLARVLGLDIYKDIDRKPTSQLGSLVKFIGLTWESRSTKQDGEKIYLYRITQDQVDQMEELVTKRMDDNLRDQWKANRKNTKENRLFDSDVTDIAYQLKQQQKRPIPQSQIAQNDFDITSLLFHNKH